MTRAEPQPWIVRRLLGDGLAKRELEHVAAAQSSRRSAMVEASTRLPDLTPLSCAFFLRGQSPLHQAFGNDRFGARRPVPAVHPERPQSVRSADLRQDAGQWARGAENSRSNRRDSNGRVRPRRSSAIEEQAGLSLGSCAVLIASKHRGGIVAVVGSAATPPSKDGHPSKRCRDLPQSARRSRRASEGERCSTPSTKQKAT